VTFPICEKRKSVLECSAHCLVLGGPGSGKTTLGLLKAKRRIEEGLRPGQTVLFLSFSRAAVARMAKAAEELAPNLQLLLSIQTFHSFFLQVLRGHGYLLGAPRGLRVVLTHEEASLRDGIKSDDANWKDWEDRRRQMFHEDGLICFDQFAPLAVDLLQRAARIRHRIISRHPLIVVDEAQDTNEEQWGCIRHLSTGSQIICLADPDQMIYGHLPGVSKERLPAIRSVLAPHEIDLGGENNRSPGTDIVQFARDIYVGKVRGGTYKGVTVQLFNKTAANRDKAIRSSVGRLRKLIEDQTGAPAKTIGVLASYAKGVAVVSAALQQDKPIFHQVLFDEAFALLSARAAAFLLEPKSPDMQTRDVAQMLELLAAAFRAKGTAGGRAIREKCMLYASQLRSGKNISFKVVKAARHAIIASSQRTMIGDPRRDWSAMKAIMQETKDQSFSDMAAELDYLVAFGRGRRIAEALSGVWIERGTYENARDVLDAALAQDQLLSDGETHQGVIVMNSHKAKGKQFDGVVLYRQEHHSPFVWRQEAAPFPEGCRLLHMAITRASKHVLVLSEAFPACPIMKKHNL
jgi:DNA helicase-2/ATP-dependent DNA helicase PcrA